MLSQFERLTPEDIMSLVAPLTAERKLFPVMALQHWSTFSRANVTKKKAGK